MNPALIWMEFRVMLTERPGIWVREIPIRIPSKMIFKNSPRLKMYTKLYDNRKFTRRVATPSHMIKTAL